MSDPKLTFVPYSPLAIKTVMDVMSVGRGEATEILRAIDSNGIQVDWSEASFEELKEIFTEARSLIERKT